MLVTQSLFTDFQKLTLGYLQVQIPLWSKAILKKNSWLRLLNLGDQAMQFSHKWKGCFVLCIEDIYRLNRDLIPTDCEVQELK